MSAQGRRGSSHALTSVSQFMNEKMITTTAEASTTISPGVTAAAARAGVAGPACG